MFLKRKNSIAGRKKSRATEGDPVSVRRGRLCGAKATLRLKQKIDENIEWEV